MPAQTQQGQAQQIELAKIFPNPEQPRQFFDRAKLEELKRSIAKNGLLQPIVVVPTRRKDGRRMGGKYATYKIVAGERRYRACKELGYDTILAIVLDAPTTDDNVFKMAAVENLVRADMTLMETARAFRRMIDEAEGETEEERAAKVSEETGVAKGTVLDRARLLTLCAEAVTAVEMGEITSRQAWQLSYMENEVQQQQLLRLIRAGKCNSRTDLYEAAKAIKTGAYLARFEQSAIAVPEEDPRVLKLQRQVGDAAATLTAIATDDNLDEVLRGMTVSQLQDLATLLEHAKRVAHDLHKRKVSFAIAAANAAEFSIPNPNAEQSQNDEPAA